MKQECRHAHEVISMAYDGEQVTNEDLRIAKTHCAECAECAAFVGGLARVRQIPAPQAPEAAIDRAMVAVKRDMERQAAQTAKAHRDAAERPTEQTDSTPVARLRRSWTVWGGWAAAAAAVIVAVGVITANGVRYMNTPVDKAATEATLTAEQQATYGAPPATNKGAYPPYGDAAALSRADKSAPGCVVFQEFVYLIDPQPRNLTDGAALLGSLPSDLGSGTVLERDVYAGSAPGSIVIGEDRRSGYAASAVVRQLGGRSYGLRSAQFSEYGVWPTLPGMAQPTAADGSPVFEEYGTDDAGVTIYVIPGTDPTSGFAVAPGTAGTDPAAGNPNWTWWAPLR